ncbi:hypothetical protein D7316_04022 [Gordonia insulae]|uniref:Uncharacterized protein n=1 Tax=Gordonia insulae TaxID=2420509 RepID=A0A3G8JSE8_9ACTN|nr:hypothetical protein D7316_04022 [Gordonia insulae]
MVGAGPSKGLEDDRLVGEIVIHEWRYLVGDRVRCHDGVSSGGSDGAVPAPRYHYYIF